MERRCQEVIDRCWQLGDATPSCPSTTWARAVCPTRCPSWCTTRRAAAASSCARCPTTSRACRPLEPSGATSRRSATCWPSRPNALPVRRHVQARALRRTPWSARPPKKSTSRCPTRTSATRRSTCRCPCCSASRPRCARRARIATRAKPLDTSDMDVREAALRVLRLPAVADKTFLITIGDRTRHRPGGARPDGGALAGARGGLRRDHRRLRHLRGRGHGDGRAHAARAARRGRVRRAWRSARPSPTSLRPHRAALAGAPERQLDGARRAPRRGRRPVRHGEGRGHGALPGARHRHPGGQGFACPCAHVARGRRSQERVTAPLSLIVSAFAPVSDVRKALTPQLRRDAATPCWCWSTSAGAEPLGGSRWRRCTSSWATSRAGPRRPELLIGFFARSSELASGACWPTTTAPTAACSPRCSRWPSRAARGLDVGSTPRAARRSPHPVQRRARRGAAGARDDLEEVLLTFARTASTARARACHRQARTTISVLHPCRQAVLDDPRAPFLRAPGRETSYRMQALRDNPTAPRGARRAARPDRSGLSASCPSTRPRTSPRRSSTGVRPRVAILREQGVNGQVEMAAAFDRAGFEASTCT
jgi:phosphoribosylformylglycinamidine synthase